MIFLRTEDAIPPIVGFNLSCMVTVRSGRKIEPSFLALAFLLHFLFLSASRFGDKRFKLICSFVIPGEYTFVQLDKQGPEETLVESIVQIALLRNWVVIRTIDRLQCVVKSSLSRALPRDKEQRCDLAYFVRV